MFLLAITKEKNIRLTIFNIEFVQGSWTQGGQRSLGPPGTGGEGAGPGKPGSTHPNAPPQLSAQAGLQQQQQQQPFPPQIRGVMPSFVSKKLI